MAFGISQTRLVFFTRFWYFSLAYGIFHLCLVFFNSHLVCFTRVWYFSLAFGIFVSHLVFFTRIWYFSLALHASAGDREIFRDGEHQADCDSSIPWCMADIRKVADKSYEGKIFKDALVNWQGSFHVNCV